MPAAVQRPNLLVTHVGNHLEQFGVLTEEVLAYVRAVLGLEVLVLPVDTLLHPLAQ